MEAIRVIQFKGNIVEIKTKDDVRLYYFEDCIAVVSKGDIILNSNEAVYTKTAVKYLNIWLDYWGGSVKYKDIKNKAKRIDMNWFTSRK